MTLTTTSNVDRYTAAEDQTAFAYTFRVDDSTHMEVSVAGVVQGSGYTISNVGNDNGGNVTFTNAPRISGAAAVVVALRRLVPLTQSTNLPTQGALDTDALEGEVDRNVMRTQQLAEVDSRTLKLPIESTLTDVGPTDLVGNGGRFLAVNAGETAVLWATPAGTGVPISTFMETVLDDTTAAAARATLGALNTQSPTTLTLSSGSVTGTGLHHVIAAETNDEDDLDTLATTNYSAGDIVYLRADAGDKIHVTKAGNFNGLMVLDEAYPTAFMLVGSTWVAQRPAFEGPSGRRSVVRNGAMLTAQMGETFAAVAHEEYTLDQWGVYWNAKGTGVGTVTKGAGPVAEGFPKSLRFDTTTADATLGVSEYLTFEQRFTGRDLQVLQWGTAKAHDAVLSFWVKATLTGTYVASIWHDNGVRWQSKAYTVNTTDTWEFKILRFVADTTTAIANDVTRQLSLHFFMASGSTFTTGTNGVWSGANGDLAAGQTVNVLDNVANDFLITGIQMEPGFATPFEHMQEHQYLADCLEFYERFTTETTNQPVPGQGDIVCATTSQTRGVFNFSRKRLASAVAFAHSGNSDFLLVEGDGTNSAVTSLTMDSVGLLSGRIIIAGTGTPLTVGQGARLIANGASSGYLEISCRL